MGPAALESGVPHGQGFVQDWTASCQYDRHPWYLGVFQGQGQNKPWEEKSTGAGTELGVEPGELDTEAVGSQI